MELMIVIAAAILAWVVGAIWYRLTDRVYAHASALQVQNIGHPKARSVVPYLLAGVALVAVAGLALRDLSTRRMPRHVPSHQLSASAYAALIPGGLALAAFELAEAAGLGVTLDSADIAQLYGEDQARYLVACTPANAEALARAAQEAGVPLARVGRFGGDAVTLGGDSAPDRKSVV